MAKLKIIVSDPETGKSKSVELEGPKAVPFIGLKLGDTVDGSVLGIPGAKLQITGGSDKDGFPMRKDVHGGVRVGIILSEGVGFKPKRKGERQRKNLRGNIITEEIVQINLKTSKPKKEKAEIGPAKINSKERQKKKSV